MHRSTLNEPLQGATLWQEPPLLCFLSPSPPLLPSNPYPLGALSRKVRIPPEENLVELQSTSGEGAPEVEQPSPPRPTGCVGSTGPPSTFVCQHSKCFHSEQVFAAPRKCILKPW